MNRFDEKHAAPLHHGDETGPLLWMFPMNANRMQLANLSASDAVPATSLASSPANTDWFRDAQYGVFLHFLPGDAEGWPRSLISTSRIWPDSSIRSGRNTSS